MQLPVQNQIPCAGSFGCQRIHVALNKHDDKLDRLEEICVMEKLITRKEAAEILGISIATLDAARNNGLPVPPAKQAIPNAAIVLKIIFFHWIIMITPSCYYEFFVSLIPQHNGIRDITFCL